MRLRAQLERSGHEVTDFNVAFTVPQSTFVRERSLMLHLRRMFPGPGGERRKFPVVELKDPLKWVAYDALAAGLHVPFECVRAAAVAYCDWPSPRSRALQQLQQWTEH